MLGKRIFFILIILLLVLIVSLFYFLKVIRLGPPCGSNYFGCKPNEDCVLVGPAGSFGLKCIPHGQPYPICLASNTMISTPKGDINVKSLAVGNEIWSVNKNGQRVISTVVKISNTLVPKDHQVIHLILNDGKELWASPKHPTANNLEIKELKVGDSYDGSTVKQTNYQLYWDDKTYDLLPSGDTGFYWANGILMGSTLK